MLTCGVFCSFSFDNAKQLAERAASVAAISESATLELDAFRLAASLVLFLLPDLSVRYSVLCALQREKIRGGIASSLRRDYGPRTG